MRADCGWEKRFTVAVVVGGVDWERGLLWCGVRRIRWYGIGL